MTEAQMVKAIKKWVHKNRPDQEGPLDKILDNVGRDELANSCYLLMLIGFYAAIDHAHEKVAQAALQVIGDADKQLARTSRRRR